MKKIIAISGSLRKDSYNTHLLKAAQEQSPEGMEITIVDISNLPFFNQDLEQNFPSEAQAFKDSIEAADGVIFATPEYNRSMPGVLKNAIDWASRPWGKNSFAKKPVLILGATPAPTGTAMGQQHLKSVLTYLDMYIIGQPEFYLGSAHEKFDASGALTDQSTKEHLRKALEVLLAK